MIGNLAALFRRPTAITATQTHQALTDGAVLLDVREQAEWRAGHAPRARHVILSQVEDHLGALPTDRAIVIVCRSGRRSAIAANLLNRHGCTATNITGGMNAWTAASLPVVTDSNKRGQII